MNAAAAIAGKGIVLRPPKKWIPLRLMMLLTLAALIAARHPRGRLEIFNDAITLVLSAGWLVNLHPKAEYLKIEPDGFAIRSYFFTRRFRWSDAHGFCVARIRGQNRVVWNRVTECESRLRPEVPLHYAMDGKGHQGIMLDNYGMTPEKLAEFMEVRRKKSLGTLVA